MTKEFTIPAAIFIIIGVLSMFMLAQTKIELWPFKISFARPWIMIALLMWVASYIPLYIDARQQAKKDFNKIVNEAIDELEKKKSTN